MALLLRHEDVCASVTMADAIAAMEEAFREEGEGAVLLPPRTNMKAGKGRSEEHTSELQSQSNLVCRLLLEKKKHRIADDGFAGQAEPGILRADCGHVGVAMTDDSACDIEGLRRRSSRRRTEARLCARQTRR